MKPISVQLYSLREQAEKDFVGVLKRVAAIGYKGVEPAGFWNLTPKELKKIVTDLGMVISSTHSPWANPDNLNQVIEVASELGIDLVACGYGRNDFKDLDAIKATADKVNGMQEKLAAAGITLFQHNHDFEFERIKGLMGRLGMDDGEPIEHRLVSNAIEKAQKRVEGHNFDIRKHLIEYDDVIQILQQLLLM